MLATDLKTGTIFKEDNSPFYVIKYEHIKSARSGATVKVKVRNLITNQVLLKSYTGTTKVEDADVRRQNVQFLYQDGDLFYFMDPDTYEQLSITKDKIEEEIKFLKEGEKVQMMYFEDEPVSIQLPATVTFEITYTEPGFKGNTVTNAYKDATLENGTVIKVPPFMKIGDNVKINTETQEYVSKA
jgi:elongation factor P